MEKGTNPEKRNRRTVTLLPKWQYLRNCNGHNCSHPQHTWQQVISTGNALTACFVMQTQVLFLSFTPTWNCHLIAVSAPRQTSLAAMQEQCSTQLSYGAWARNMDRTKNEKVWECARLPTAAQDVEKKAALFQSCSTKRLVTWALL